jgi:hypothetical protein
MCLSCLSILKGIRHNGKSISILEKWFQENKSSGNFTASQQVKIILANKCSLSVKQVHDCIQNRRNKIRKDASSPDYIAARRIFLKSSFNSNQRPNKEQLYSLSLLTGLSSKKIYSWFKRERFQLKNKEKIEFNKYRKRMIKAHLQVLSETYIKDIPKNNELNTIKIFVENSCACRSSDQ